MMTTKELEDKLNSLYDQRMMTFTVKTLPDGNVLVSYLNRLTDQTNTMFEIRTKKDDIEIVIAYIKGQIDGYKERQQRLSDFSSIIQALETIKDFAEEKLKEVA